MYCTLTLEARDFSIVSAYIVCGCVQGRVRPRWGRRRRRTGSGRGGSRAERGSRLAGADVHQVDDRQRLETLLGRLQATLPQRGERHPRRHSSRQASTLLTVWWRSSAYGPVCEVLGMMPGFHHSVAVLPLPFHRSAVVKFRCSVKLRTKMPFRYGRKQQKDTQQQRQRQRCTETATANGNGVTATEERQRNGGNWAWILLWALVRVSWKHVMYNVEHWPHTLTAVHRSTRSSTVDGTIKSVSAFQLSN